MSQDTTLPPLPDERAAFEAWYAALPNNGRKAGLTLLDAWQARAAIAAQAQQASPTCVWIVESKTFSVLYATKAEAEKYMASLPITVSGGMSISAVPVIGAQQAQGVPRLDDFDQPIVYDTDEIDLIAHALTGDEGEDDGVTVLHRLVKYLEVVHPGKNMIEVLTETEDARAAAPQAEPVHKQSSDIRAVFEAWVEGYPIQIVEDDYEMCFDAFQAGYAVKAEPQPEREPFR